MHPPPQTVPTELDLPAWQLLERSLAATAVLDLDGWVRYVNPAFLGLFGYAGRDHVLGRSADLAFWAGRDEARSAFRTALADGVWQGELLARRADDTPMTVTCSAHVMRDAGGRPVSMMASFVDRRAEVAAREVLREEQRLVDTVVASAGVLVLVLDAGGRIVRFSPECERVTGWSAPQVLGRVAWERLSAPETRAEDAATFERLMRDAGPPERTSTTWLTRGGSRRIVECTCSRQTRPGDGAPLLVAIGVDATARVAAEAALRRNEARLRQAQQLAGLGSWHHDLASGRFECSDAVRRLFGLPDAPEPSFAAMMACIADEDRPAVDAALRREVETGTPQHVEFRVRLAGGRIRWVEQRCESERGADGRALRTLGTVLDATARRSSLNALRRFEHLVEQSTQEVWLFDLDWTIRYVNRAAAASLGWRPDELVGRPVAEFDAGGPEFVARIRQRAKELIAQGATRAELEVVHRARDGRLIPKAVRSTFLEIDGELLVCSFAEDITERRRLQAVLADSEATLRRALDAFPGWVTCIDDDQRYVYANDAFLSDRGLVRDRVIGRTVAEVRGERTAARIVDVMARLRGDETIERERRLVTPDGRLRTYWTTFRAQRDPLRPDRWLYFSFGIDVTEARRTETRLNTIVEATRIGTWEWNAQTGELLLNKQMAALVGLAPTGRAVTPRELFDGFVHPEDRAARKAQFLRMIRGEADSVEGEFRARHADGHWVWLLERMRVVSRASDGAALGMIGTLQDVSARRRQDEELQRLNAELEARVVQRTAELAAATESAERASAAKTEFLSRMSHELRTPLNAILGFSQLMRLGALPPEQAEHVGEILRAGRHLLTLIDEVLDLAGVESGRIRLEPEALSPAALVDECLALLRPQAVEAALRVENRVDPHCTAVLADRGRLTQVLLNLLSNGIKYNRHGGTLTVECACGDGAACELRVTDAGPGLTPAQIERLFQPFERLDAKRGSIPGTGIGLSVSKRLVELMGGAIGVDSVPGAGSTFWIRLPAARSTMPPRGGSDAVVVHPQAEAGRAPSAARRVLYVEDNASNQRLMRHVLGMRADVELVVIGDAREAVACALSLRPALVLLDIQLPYLDGYQVLAAMRAAGVAAPVVAVSANAMPEDVARGAAAGFADYLTKPLDVRRVLDVVDGQLRASARPAEPPAPTAPPAPDPPSA